MTLQVGLIKQNFQEIYSSLNESPYQLNLVANYSGTHIYDSNKGWGRFWRLFYRLNDLFLKNNLRLNRLKQALIHTHNLFENQLPIVQTHLHSYLNYLKQASGGYAINERPIHLNRKAITLWNEATNTYLKLLKGLQHKKMLRLISCIRTTNQNTLPFTTSLTQRVKMCSRIIALEGVSAAPLPLQNIKKIFKQKPIHALDIKELKKWINKINTQASHLNIIHKGISSLTKFFNTQNNRENTNYLPEALESFLETNGCTVFEKTDRKQIIWRKQTWKPGAIIRHGQTSFEIGKPLVHSNGDCTNNFLVFDLSSSKSIALIPPNRVKLSLTSFKPKTVPIPTAQIIEIMNGGRWALIERLSPINSIPWSSTTTPLSVDDLQKANALASLIKKCIETNSMPQNLSASNIMFDAQGTLKCLYPTSEQPFDFHALENFAYRAAAGIPAIFQYLMNTSGLLNHTIAKYYLAVTISTLKKESIHMANLGGIYRIGNSQVIDKAASFAKELSQLYTQLTSTVQEQHPEYDREILEKKIAESLLNHYRSNCAVSFLWPTFAESIIKTFSHSQAPLS
jgi:hypothetical protein